MLHAKHKHSIAYVANPVGRPLIYHLIQSPPKLKDIDATDMISR